MHNNSILLQIADKHLLSGFCCQYSGLWNGKMGISVFFFLLSKVTGNKHYKDYAGELLDDVCSNLSFRTPICFADGLCGIGWAIEYLKAEGFIKGNTNDILSEVDKQIINVRLDTKEFEDYEIYSVNVSSFSGTFNQVEEFFEYVNNYDKIVRIDSLSFRKNVITGTLGGELRMSFYFKKSSM